ncbi:GIY-YIG nuclease superfamily protein [Vibrio phage 1.085.O._10N.222.51.E3]|nr:GIY-YIG nuclease superfamily protein [Vibrio phage 1.085.O._10N.222.51.E3]
MINSGVYLLLDDDDNVVYVGRSKNISSRLSVHRRSGKEFTHHSVIECEGFDQRVIEREQIHKHNPKYNKCMHNRDLEEEVTLVVKISSEHHKILSDDAKSKGRLFSGYLSITLEEKAKRIAKRKQQDKEAKQ